MPMQLEEAQKLVQQRGWSPIVRTRKGQKYLYARHWNQKELYITSLLKLPNITQEQVQQKVPMLPKTKK